MTENKEKTAPLSASRRQWLKRQANHIVAQLPENEAEALFVIELARRLVIHYLSEENDGGRDIHIITKT